MQIISSLEKEGVLIVKNGKNPNVEQKKLLAANGYDCNEWLVIKDRGASYEFRKKFSDSTSSNGPEVIVLDKKSK